MRKWLVYLCFCFILTGCLKTRSQIRGDDPDPARAEELNDGARSPGAEPVPAAREVPGGNYVLEEVRNEVVRLTGKIEDLEKANLEKSQKDSEVLAGLEQRIGKMEGALGELKSSLEKPQAAPQPSDGGPEGAAARANLDELFRQAKSNYHAAKYADAAEGFGTYLKELQENSAAQGSKAAKVLPKNLEEAVYLRAESYFQLKQYKKAVVEYSKFPEKYKRSRYMPDSLYKIGLCFEGLNMKEDAQGFFLELTEKYPNSAEAKKAKKKLHVSRH